MKNIAERAFDFGIEAATYADAIKTLFNEAYFLEKWITEMLTQEKKLSNEEHVLMGNLARISTFF